MRAEAADHPTSAGKYKVRWHAYDKMGRLAVLNNWSEINSGWELTGDDAAGYTYTIQEFDWNGRPTTFTNQDGTTRETSYSGCGCAGGQVVTLVDEMGRRRDQTYDILGRMWRERIYNWGGSNGDNVYSTTTYTYNKRDQITKINVKDNASGASQNTVMTYDVYGRLKTRQLPQYLGNPQSATPYMSYEYNADDTLMKETDPRGASATYDYNGRRLVTSITYGVPSGVAPTPNVTFTYDEAGNRTRMDDGPGIVTYTYDTLSRMTSETRVFDGISQYIYQGTGQPHQNTFTIGYDYTLAGGLKRIVTPTGDTIDYSLDRSGMVFKVSGTPRDGVTDYVKDIKYRAWGAAKQISYGYSNSTITAQHNARMLISNLNNQDSFGASFGYDLDGRLKTVQGLNGYARTLDRSFNYDHVGRVTQTRSGSAAGLGSTEPEQLKQTYTYDAFNHLASRSGTYWYLQFEGVYSAPYTNDRGTSVTWRGDAQNWQYDVAGSIKSHFNGGTSWNESLEWNAAGQMVKNSSSFPPTTEGGRVVWFYDYEYDGDGNLVSKTKGVPGIPLVTTSKSTDYSVRSTVLSKPLLSLSVGGYLQNGQYTSTVTPSRQLRIYVGGEEVVVRNYDTMEAEEKVI